jgi:hypothetical protein
MFEDPEVNGLKERRHILRDNRGSFATSNRRFSCYSRSPNSVAARPL